MAFSRSKITSLLMPIGDTKKTYRRSGYLSALKHDMASTRLSVRGRTFYGESPGILSCTDDVREGKLQAVIRLLPEYVHQKDYYEILYITNEATACAPWNTSIFALAAIFLDAWATECEKSEYYNLGLEWLWLFVEAGELLSLSEEYDSSKAEPNKCKDGSLQHLALKIRQIAGRFAARWPDNPFDRFYEFESAIGEEEYQS